ncbi:hypothetical protein KUTeg_017603 [Tegillarca granosa]|uniref:Ig-like domain-containing protein n=1 Tax=Tegillarca granosa TaxID=220873 RepID=A0ABQ9EKV7_TEGGR|nr:hypothetical protein KUTeg_017603 [Tegillarca granosa]
MELCRVYETEVIIELSTGLHLNINLPGSSTQKIIWKKTTQSFALTIGDFVYTLDSSFSIEHEKKKNEKNVWNLVIKNVQKFHSGVYECQISTKEDLRRNVTLTVLDAKPKKNKHLQGSQKPQKKKSKAAIHISGPEFVDFGSEIVLSCNATGIEYPPEDVDWFKDGLKIKGDSAHEIFVTKFRQSETKMLISELIIRHSELQDSGTYICRSSDLEITSHNLMLNQIKPRDGQEQKLKMETPLFSPERGALIMEMGTQYTEITLFYTLFC